MDSSLYGHTAYAAHGLARHSSSMMEAAQVVEQSSVAVPQGPSTAARIGSSVLTGLLTCGTCVATYYTWSLYKKRQELTTYKTRRVSTETQVKTDVTSSFRNMLMSLVSATKEEDVVEEELPTIVETDGTKKATLSRKEIILQQQRLLNTLQRKVPNEKLGVQWTDDDTHMIKTAVEQLDDKFLMVVVGEFNSGKSAFINSMLGGRFVQEGILPTTDNVCKISYGSHEEVSRNAKLGYMHLKVPVPWLKDVNIVDTPGTNALAELGHQAITERFLPQSDLVVFVTSAERPLTQSEKDIILKIKGWGRQMVVMVNKVEQLEEEDKNQVLDFVRGNLEQIWPGNNLQIFGVSARLAQTAKLESSRGSEDWERLWAASNLASVERYVFKTLDSTQKMKWKLMKPQNVASHAIELYSDALGRKTESLGQELSQFSTLGKTVEEHHKKLWEDFQKNYVEQFDMAFNRLMERATSFVDHHVNFTSVNFFLNPQAVQRTFREEVCMDFQQDIESTLVKLTDWLTESRARIEKRVRHELNHIISQTTHVLESMKTNGLPYNAKVGEESQQLKLQDLRTQCTTIIQRFSKDEIHSRELVDHVRNSLYQMAVLEGSAAVSGLMAKGLMSQWVQKRSNTGAVHKVFNLLAGPTTSLADELASPVPILFCLVGGTSLALWGANTMHFRREQVKRTMAREKDMMQARLLRKIQSHVEEKVQDSINEMTDWLHPFLEAVSKEEEILDTMRKDLKEWQTNVASINNDIELAAKEWEKDSDAHMEGHLTNKNPLVFPTATPLTLPPTLQRANSAYSVPPPMYHTPRGSQSLSLSRSNSLSNPPYYQYSSPSYPDLNNPYSQYQYQQPMSPPMAISQPTFVEPVKPTQIAEVSAPPEEHDFMEQVNNLPPAPTHIARSKVGPELEEEAPPRALTAPLTG